jgi:DNA primase
MDRETVQYLLDRGLSKETAEYFRLGAVRDPLPTEQSYRNRLSIPYQTKSGIVSLRFRVLPPKESDSKYLGYSGISAKKLFNTLDLYTDKPVYICEGEVDTMTAHQVGLNAVGVAGVSNWDPNWWRIFVNRKVFVLADNDDNGQGLVFAQGIEASLKNVTVVLMESGHDVNSLVNSRGAAGLLELIKESDKKRNG